MRSGKEERAREREWGGGGGGRGGEGGRGRDERWIRRT